MIFRVFDGPSVYSLWFSISLKCTRFWKYWKFNLLSLKRPLNSAIVSYEGNYFLRTIEGINIINLLLFSKNRTPGGFTIPRGTRSPFRSLLLLLESTKDVSEDYPWRCKSHALYLLQSIRIYRGSVKDTKIIYEFYNVFTSERISTYKILLAFAIRKLSSFL
jgi:hypothetical protein